LAETTLDSPSKVIVNCIIYFKKRKEKLSMAQKGVVTAKTAKAAKAARNRPLDAGNTKGEVSLPLTS
jgi:hypothetical protein